MTGAAGFPAGVVFDCDGTLVDTERLSRRATEQALAEVGLAFTDHDFLSIVGRAWPDSSRYLMESVGVADIDGYRVRVSELFAGRFDAEVAPFADALGVARGLSRAGVPMAVCTSSGRIHLDRVLAMPSLAGLSVAATVTREDTSWHKPDPAPYALAASRLGVAADACVAVEDSPTGARSAMAAGMRVVVVDRGNHTAEEFSSLDLSPVRTLTLEHLLA